jgi:protein-disulfide isomerase
LAAEGTPYFFINGQRLPGAQPKETFEAVVEQELERVEAILSKKPSAEPYALLQASAAPPPGLTPVVVPAPEADMPTWGPLDAPVVVHMFSDFECGFCQRVMYTLRELVTRHPGQVRIVWRNLPLPFHKNARWAARVALEVREQRGDAAFWQLAERLFGMTNEAPEPLTPELINRYATEAGIAADSLAELSKSDDHDSSIDRDLILAEGIGATGTPTFVINGYRLVGAQPIDRFERLVNLALKDANR